MTTTWNALPDAGGEARIVALSAGTSESSTTTRLATDLLAAATAAAGAGLVVRTEVVELKPLAQDIAAAIATGFRSGALATAYEAIGAADAVIVASPVYKASYSGLLKAFLDVADDDLLTATPVVVAATAGTPRHGLVPDTEMRPLLSYMRAFTVPTAVFAATEDWSAPTALGKRVSRAAHELVELVRSGVRGRVLGTVGGEYSRTFDGSSATTDRAEGQISFDSDLMRLAAGGGRHGTASA